MKLRDDFLRPEQWEAVNKMKIGCILNGGTGSGKSRTSLVYYYLNYRDLPLYIITTAAKRDKLEWIAELLPFDMPHNNIIVDSWNNIKKYSNVNSAFFIFDEDRVTGSGVWVKTFLRITNRNKWIILSATPGDKWEDYIPVFVANRFYRSRNEFMSIHAVYSRWSKFPKVEKWLEIGTLMRYRNRILVEMEVERYTTRHEEIVYCNYDMAKYKEVMKTRWDIYKDEPIQQASGLCYVLRKLVNLDDSRQVKLLELLEDRDKVIIFYNFDYELEILRGLGYRKGTKIAEWNGHNHEPIPKTKKWVYLVQYNAGCEGWNCIETDTIIFFSQTYSYKVLEQSRGRIDRMNTGFRDLYYYHFMSHSKIDMAIRSALNHKKKFNEGKFVEKL